MVSMDTLVVHVSRPRRFTKSWAEAVSLVKPSEQDIFEPTVPDSVPASSAGYSSH